MKKFNYTMNHKADEAYMAKMCHEGWAATSLVEGVWTFEPCKPDQYVYRVCYLRGKSAAEVEALKNKLAAQGIEFVSHYSFWAIFRSEHDFRLYAPEEELAVCESIYRPMPIGSVLSWLAFIAFLLLSGTGQRVDGNRSKWPYRLFEKTYINFNRMQAEHQAKGEWLDSWKVEINPRPPHRWLQLSSRRLPDRKARQGARLRRAAALPLQDRPLPCQGHARAAHPHADRSPRRRLL